MVVVLGLFALLVVACKSNDSASNDSASAQIMNMMHMPMMVNEFQITENPDIDYLVNMMPHHQGAIDSSQAYLMVATNEDVKIVANKIIQDQEREIAEFNMLLPDLRALNTDYSTIDYIVFGEESSDIMDVMMKNMMSTELTGNPDVDFLQGMIPHHQGAIDASNKILEITTDERIKEIANAIIVAQEKEIAEMIVLIDSQTNGSL